MSRSAPTPPDDESRQYPHWRRNLLVLPPANLLCGLGFNLSWPFVPLMVRGLGVRENLETWVGAMLLVFYLVSTAASPLWGGIADHYGRKPMVLRAMLGMGVAMMLVPLAPTPLWFAGLIMVVAVFNGFTPAGVALLVANTPPGRIGAAVAYAQTGGLVGQALGPALGAAVAALIDRQHALYWISGGLMLSGGLLVALFVREVKQLAPGPWRPQLLGSLRELAAVPRIVPLFVLAFLFSIMWHGSVINISVFVLQLLEAGGAGAGEEAYWVGAAAVALAVSMLVATPIWGRVIDRFGSARVLAFGAAATAVTHLPLLVLQTPLELVLARIAFGLTAAGLQTALFHLLRAHAPPGMDARAIAYATAFQFLAMGVAPFLAGLIGPVFGMRAYFAVTIVGMIGGLALWLRGTSHPSRIALRRRGTEGKRVTQSRDQIVRIHPLVVRITHWINAFAILVMIASGWRIYNASPLFGFTFPNDWTLGGWLAGALQWHFAAMWLLAANGLIYLIYGIMSGHFRRKLLPVTPAAAWRDVAAALRGKLAHGDLRVYNAAQRAAYLGAIAIGIILVLSGLVLWKPVQFYSLGLLMGDYEGARYVHFFAMAALVLFVIVHVVMVVLVPRTLPTMFTGRVRVPDAARSD